MQKPCVENSNQPVWEAAAEPAGARPGLCAPRPQEELDRAFVRSAPPAENHAFTADEGPYIEYGELIFGVGMGIC